MLTPETSPLFTTLRQSGIVGQLIILSLFMLSVYSWTLMVSKYRRLSATARTCDRFRARFRGRRDAVLHDAVRGAHAGDGPLANVLAAVAEPIREGRPATRAELEAAAEPAIAEEVVRLERKLVYLAVISSVSPFVGLFGTVWGIMRAFAAMGTQGSASIASVAPGIAEALVTTVAGLAVAIPTVVGYNLLASRARRLTVTIESFATEVIGTALLAAEEEGVTVPEIEEGAWR
jgi:biopolymer transport protein TolQ